MCKKRKEKINGVKPNEGRSIAGLCIDFERAHLISARGRQRRDSELCNVHNTENMGEIQNMGHFFFEEA